MAEISPDSDKPAAGSNKIWLRGLFMLILAVLFGFAQSLLALLAVIQFFWALFNASTPNPALKQFGASLADWLRQMARFQTFASDDKPFPWAEWPKGE